MGVLQYLVGVERITPEIVTATVPFAYPVPPFDTAKLPDYGKLMSKEHLEGLKSGARVEYRHAEAGVTEWYERDARGVEQGFTLEHAGCGDGDDVEVDVGVAGLTPRLAAGGDGVDLLDELGAVRMHYTDLSARDARGRALGATMSVKDGRIALRVAARGAVYPVVVDPEVWSEQGAALVKQGRAIWSVVTPGFTNAMAASIHSRALV